MKFNRIFLWAFFAILFGLSCNKDIEPPLLFIVGNQNNMMINNDTVHIAIGQWSLLQDYPVDIDYDGTNDFLITAGYYLFMGGSTGYQKISISTTNNEFEIFGYTANDTIWRTISVDTIDYPDYVLVTTTTGYSYIHTSPDQTIDRISHNVLKPFCYHYGDTINPSTQTYICNKVNLYRGAVTYYDCYTKNDTVRYFVYNQLNNCFNLPLDNMLFLCYINRSKTGIKYYGWLKLYLTNKGHDLKIIERALSWKHY